MTGGLVGTIDDDDLRGCVQGSVRLALVEVTAVTDEGIDGKVLLAIAGDLAANLELEPVGRLETSAVRVGQQLVVAVSPFRHRTTKLALTGYEMVAPGEQDRVVANCRRRLAEIKGGL